MKMKVYFITSNKAKFEWARRRLKGSDIELIQKELSIEESRDASAEAVALSKAKFASKLVKASFIVEDSGFYIKSLNNFPSTHIRFVLGTIGAEGILKLMEGKKDRRGIFGSALVFWDGKKEKVFSCEDKGTIPDAPRGDNIRGFNDLNKIFIPNGFGKTLAEMSDEEFSAYEKKVESRDHYRKFADWLGKK